MQPASSIASQAIVKLPVEQHFSESQPTLNSSFLIMFQEIYHVARAVPALSETNHNGQSGDIFSAERHIPVLPSAIATMKKIDMELMAAGIAGASQRDSIAPSIFRDFSGR
jgi:hypothetical protein